MSNRVQPNVAHAIRNLATGEWRYVVTGAGGTAALGHHEAVEESWPTPDSAGSVAWLHAPTREYPPVLGRHEVENGDITTVQRAEWQTKDSGTRREFDTGSKRDVATGKGSYVSISPHAWRRVAALMERGAVKYERWNYMKGQPYSVVFDSLMRHMLQAFSGMKDEDHLAAVIANAMFLIHYDEEIKAGRLPATLNDLPRYVDA